MEQSALKQLESGLSPVDEVLMDLALHITDSYAPFQITILLINQTRNDHRNTSNWPRHAHALRPPTKIALHTFTGEDSEDLN